MVVCALAAVQSDGVVRQGDDLGVQILDVRDLNKNESVRRLNARGDTCFSNIYLVSPLSER